MEARFPFTNDESATKQCLREKVFLIRLETLPKCGRRKAREARVPSSHSRSSARVTFRSLRSIQQKRTVQVFGESCTNVFYVPRPVIFSLSVHAVMSFASSVAALCVYVYRYCRDAVIQLKKVAPFSLLSSAIRSLVSSFVPLLSRISLRGCYRVLKSVVAL